jgi:YVTN family beta-propeller protein
VNNTVKSSINVGTGPETMCIVGDKLYVTNCGGYGLDSTISIIDMNSNTELSKIVVGDAPVAIASDVNGKVWVLCRGSYGIDFNTSDDDTKGQFVQIDPSNNQILKVVSIGNKGDHPDKMRINAAKNTMYYLSSYQSISGVYKFNINDSQASTTAFISGFFYGLGYEKGKDQLYLGEVSSFTQNAKIKRYTSAGTLMETYTTGIGTNGIGE